MYENIFKKVWILRNSEESLKEFGVNFTENYVQILRSKNLFQLDIFCNQILM